MRRERHTTSPRPFRLLLTLALSLFFTVTHAQLYSDNIHVVINDLGNARISETRQVYIDRGTEGYIKMYDLQGRSIGDLAVSDENGNEFTNITPWRVNASFDEKAFKCGIYDGEKGKELCWGISSYGDHIHHIRYTLTRLVKSYDDFDGFIFTFYQGGQPYAQNMSVTIEGIDKHFTSDDTRVWSFGHYGNIGVENGKIEVHTLKPFESNDEKMIVMVQFKKGMFHPATTVSSTFYKAVKRHAFRGSDYEDTDKEDAKQATLSSGGGMGSSSSSSLDGFMWMLILIFAPVVLIAAPILTKRGCDHDKAMHSLFGNVKGKVENWFRGIPCGGNLNKTASTLYAIDGKRDPDALRKAYILRMVYDKRLQIVTQNDGRGNFWKSFLVTEPKNDIQDSSSYDNVLHHLLWQASGSDHVLDPNELNTFVRRDPVKLRPIASKLSSALSRDFNGSIYGVKKQDATEVFGMRKFLKEFTLSSERSIEEVALWKEYLVHATLFGIAEQVIQDMHKVMPDFNQLSALDNILLDAGTLSMVSMLSTIANNASNYVTGYKTPAELEAERSYSSSSSSSYSRSSGGGGRSSYSGGRGSGGGGGSGYR